VILRRLPIESAQPVLVFAATRLAVTLAALLATIVLGFPYGGRAAGLLAGLGLPWSLAVLILARREPEIAINPLIAAGDFALLALLEVVVPEAYGGVRFGALFLVAAHAHFQGERRGVLVAALAAGGLVLASAVRGDQPLDTELVAVYDTVFVIAALSTAIVVGRLRTAESASRLRARGVSRRAIQAETEARRRVAEAIHDGPVQELIGLDMILSTAAREAEAGEPQRARELIDEARQLASRNLQVLRDEIVDLGPYAFRELSFATAVENCLPVWKRRYGVEVMAAIERVELEPEMSGDLFRVAQEAIANAGRHGGAQAVSLSLRTVGSQVELRVTDNGTGFSDANPLAAVEPGHLGLASMRERAELLGGEFTIETSDRGTKVLVLAPLRTRS
jgi:two-component system NarL family sensor kinase